MTTHTTATTAKAGPTASRWVRVAVWAMFALVLFSGAGLMSNEMTPLTFGERPGAAAVAAGEVAGPNDYLFKNCAKPNCRAKYSDSPHELLPAWRWRADLELYSYSSSGWGINVRAGVNETMTALANIGFAVSNVVWTLTLFLIRYATTIDYLGALGARINQGFAALSESLIGVIGLVWLVVMLRAGKLAFKGDLPGMFRSMALFILPVAFLFYFHTQASLDSPVGNDFSEVGTAAGRAGTVTGSPVWVAQEVTEKMNLVVDGATGGITLFGSATADVMRFPDGDRSWPHCDAYLDKLYQQYNAAASSNGNAAAASTALEQVSKFWAVTVYAPWMDAQFGNRFQRGKVACQMLEERSGTPAHERILLLSSMDGAPSAGPSKSTLENGHGEQIALEARGHKGGLSGKVQRDRWLAFAACYYDNGWKMNWRWVAVGEPSIGEQSGYDKDQLRSLHDNNTTNIDSKWCQVWWEKGYAVADNGKHVTPEIDGYGGLRVGMGEVDKLDHGTTLYDVESSNARAFMRDFYGGNGTTRLMLGLIAALSSLVYLFVLGGVAFGALLAQFGLVILLIFLPVSIIGLAAGADFGRRMVKLTIALCGSKLMFALLLSVMTQLTLLGLVLFSKVGGDVAAGGTIAGGLTNSVASALVPLLVLFLVNRALSSMGMAKLTSPTGALSAVGKLSNAAAGKGSVGDFLSNKAKGGGKITNALRAKSGELGAKAGGAMLNKVPVAKNLRHRTERKAVREAEAGYKRWLDSADVKDKKRIAAGQPDPKTGAVPTAEEKAAAKAWLDDREKSFGKEIGSKQARLSRLEALDDNRFERMFGLKNAGSFRDNAVSLVKGFIPGRRGDDTLDDGHFALGFNGDALEQVDDIRAIEAVSGEQSRAVARAVKAGYSGADAARAEVAATIGAAEVAMIGQAAELTVPQLDAVVRAASGELKVDPSNLIATTGGLVVPDVFNLTADARVQIANTEWAAALTLPDEVIGVREIAEGVQEAAEDRARRIAGALASIGALSVDGGQIQIAAPEVVLAGTGVELGTLAGAELWRDFVQGAEDALASMPRITIPPSGSPAQLMWDSAVRDIGPQAEAILDQVEVIRQRTEQEITDLMHSALNARTDVISLVHELEGLTGSFSGGGDVATAAAQRFAEIQQEASNELAKLVRDSVTVGTRAFSEGEIDLSKLHSAVVDAIEAETNRLAVHANPADLAAALRKVTDDYMAAAETAGQHAIDVIAEAEQELQSSRQSAARFGSLAPSIRRRLPRDPRGGL